MRKPIMTKVMMLVVFTTALASAFLKMYYIRDDGGATVLWNADEAYIFVVTAQRGFHLSYLKYPWAFFREDVGGVTAPNDERALVTVIHVTQSGIERHQLETFDVDGTAGFFTPLKGQIYANCPALGGLCRWANDHFERATEEERRALGDIDHLTLDELRNENGWSSIAIGPDGPGTIADHQSEVDVGKWFTLLIKNHRLDGSVSVDLKRPGHPTERIWGLSHQPRRVSSSEYKRAFSGL
jgi:hypothetical protein